MFMADLCNIFIYIIKWFLKSPACAIRSTETILIEVCLLFNKYDEKYPIIRSVFLKKKHLKAIWPSQITQSISGIAFEQETKHW